MVPKYKKGDYLFLQVKKDKYLLRVVSIKDGIYTMLHENFIRKGALNMTPMTLRVAQVDDPPPEIKVTKLTRSEANRFLMLYF